MKKIPLTQDQFAIVDDADYEWLSQFKWCADKRVRTFYVIRSQRIKGKNFFIYMHRLILGLERDDKREADHVNGDGLDNRRSNLRIVTHRQNLWNLSAQSERGSSRFKGVSWYKRDKKWRSGIRYNDQLIHLGYFDDEIDAAKAYDVKAKELFGEFARLNFDLPVTDFLEAKTRARGIK